MKSIAELVTKKPVYGWLLFAATLVIVFLLGLLASSIIERRAETEWVRTPNKAINTFEPRNSVWGESYQREYNSWLQTANMDFESKYNGNKMKDALADHPSMVILWAGYTFSKDYSTPRGHFYAVEDVRNSLRTGAPMDEKSGPQPSTCWSCKSPDVPRLMNQMGIENFYKTKWAATGSEIVNPIGCADCHDAKTMNLHISRPALIEAFNRSGKDISKASHQELRSLVCAQCHVEYYFKGEGKYLTFPWDKGTSMDSIELYYDQAGFTDFTHSLSKTPIIKAQHPDYELYLTGIHGQRGVACADCHMPYKSEGGQKFSDHHIQSPLNNIANSCQVCHRESEETLRANVYERQDKAMQIRHRLEDELVKAHLEAEYVWKKGASETQMKPVLDYIRKAQWRWDFAAASHGGAFHAPVEYLQIVSNGLDFAHKARYELSKVLASMGELKAVPLPDVSTKEKAQAYIGLDMKTLRTEKEEFINKVVPQWLQKAKEREANM